MYFERILRIGKVFAGFGMLGWLMLLLVLLLIGATALLVYAMALLTSSPQTACIIAALVSLAIGIFLLYDLSLSEKVNAARDAEIRRRMSQ